MRVNEQFSESAGTGRNISFDRAFDRFVKKLVAHTKNRTLDDAEPDIREDFTAFLHSQKYYLAAKNFEKLLEEKSGDKFLRSDGTTNWFHEFLPLMGFMYLVRLGYKDGGIDLADLEQYGGLEAAIITHLRHDSVEDQPLYREDPEAFRLELLLSAADIVKVHPEYSGQKAQAIIDQTMINIDLITQKKCADFEGKKKESIRAYTKRMVFSPEANPVVFMLKQADGVHNFATMWAPKFTPEKRLQRCNDREDMYGSRNGYTDTAIEKWPRFQKGIKVLDSMMGTMLYTHFRYLESVDLHYKDPDDSPIGITRYLSKTLQMGLPEPINMVHTFVKNLMHSVDPARDPDKHERLTTFLEENFRPAFREKHRSKFPYLFANDTLRPALNDKAGPSPVAM